MTFATLLPGLEPWMRGLSGSGLAAFVKTYFPHFQVAHLISLFVLGGCAILLNLRLVGVGFDERPSWLERRLRPLLDLSVAGALVSGFLIAAAEPMKLYVDTAFLVKMAALAAALLATYGATIPVARRDGAASLPVLAVFGAGLAVWISAVWLFAATMGTAPGVIHVIFAAALLLVAALAGRTRWLYLAGLSAIVLAQQVVTHAFVGPDDLAVLDPLNKAFTGLEALWVMAFAAVLVRNGRGAEAGPAARLIGFATILAWVTVAAAGRWIAFG